VIHGDDQGAGSDFYPGDFLYYKHLVASAVSLSAKLKLLVILAKWKLKTHLMYLSDLSAPLAWN